MKNKVAFFIAAALIVIIAVLAFSGGNDSDVYTSALGDEASITIYQSTTQAAAGGFFEVNLISSAAGDWYVNAVIESGGSDEATEGMVAVSPPTLSIGPDDGFDIEVPAESDNGGWIINNALTEINPGTNRFAFRLPERFDTANERAVVRVALSSERIASIDELEADAKTYTAPIEYVNADALLGLDVPGARPELKRGMGIPIAHAQLAGYDFFSAREGDVPDLTGGPLDCFAIATANNLLSLNDEHGANYDLPNPRDMIEELKRDMQWDDGIIGPNFLTGKAAFVERYGLPVTTREIKRPSMEDLEEALSNGDAVEISMTHIRSASGRPSTGHVITGIGAWEDGGDAGLTVHDPATGQGNDFLDVTQSGNANPFLIVNYPLWDGVSFIDAIYVQTWTEEEPEETDEDSGVSLDEDDSSEEISTGSGVLDGAEDLLGLYVETSFAHVAPGEYSEIYVRVPETGKNDEVTVTLKGPSDDTVANPSKTQVGEDDGAAYFVFRIYSYGTYTATVQRKGGAPIDYTIVVN